MVNAVTVLKINIVLYCLPSYHEEGLVLLVDEGFPSILSTDIDEGVGVLLKRCISKDINLAKGYLRLRHYDQKTNLVNLYFSGIVSPQNPIIGQFKPISEVKDNAKKIIQKTHPFST